MTEIQIPLTGSRQHYVKRETTNMTRNTKNISIIQTLDKTTKSKITKCTQ